MAILVTGGTGFVGLNLVEAARILIWMPETAFGGGRAIASRSSQ
jgi:uncharacterized protein YbjT (DUF2867 family)